MSAFIFFALVLCVIPGKVGARYVTHDWPRTANYFLHWNLSEFQAKELAKWDVLILDMELQARRPELLRQLRIWNPDIILLAYIPSQEVVQSAMTSDSAMRRKFFSGVADEWFLLNADGKKLNWWPETYLLNVTPDCPVVNGKRFSDYLIEFVNQEILSSRLWDGVFYDNAWSSVTWFVGQNVDSNRDGTADTNADMRWREGMSYIFKETRRVIDSRYVIIGNGNGKDYSGLLNGAMFENFVPRAWGENMKTYSYNETVNHNKIINIINSNTGNTGINTDYRAVRFGLGNTLLEDGYFSYDYGDKDHGQLWRYDEYDVSLGRPIGGSQSAEGLITYKPDLWRRDFQHGVAIVNSTPETIEVALGGEYEKLRGKQDQYVNDGSIVSEVTIDGYDGLILRKTFALLNDALFPNGAFARFFRPDGQRVRNGLFVFEEKYKGGDQVANIDLDGNGARDLLVVSANEITAWRDDGQPLFKLFPYTRSYVGRLNVAFGNFLTDNGQILSDNDLTMNNSHELTDKNLTELIVAPSAGNIGPIKIYSLSGEQLREDWYPFGVSYKGGYTLAIGRTGANNEPRLIVGAVGPRKKTGAVVAVFGENLKLIAEWLAFEKNISGNVSVASGDLDADGKDEIVLGASVGKPLIKVVDEVGKEIAPAFFAYSTQGQSGVAVQVTDVDFDGRKDIVTLSLDANL